MQRPSDGRLLKRQTFVQGAILLGLASFVSRLLGTVYKIPYQNITGDLGFYIYNQVYPLYAMLLVLSTAGFPIAISKMVSERLVVGDREGARRVYRISAMLLTFSGLFFFCLLFFGAPVVSAWMDGGDLLVTPLRSISLALLVVPFMAALRGYFQGHQNMLPTALSQTVEQVVRIATILLLAYGMIALYGPTEQGVVYAASGAVFGAFTGAVAALVVLGWYWRFYGISEREGTKVWQAQAVESSAYAKRESFARLLHQILRYAIPVAIGSLVLPLFNLVDAFSVKALLDPLAGESAAAKLKGIYDRGPTLVQFAAFFATAISLSLVPALADSMARGDSREGALRARLAIRLTLLFGLPAAVGLAVLSRPINIMLFTDGSGSGAIAIGAATVLFSTLSITCTGILQGIGRMGLPARNLLVAVGVKSVLNLLFIPYGSIEGAALATVLAYLVAAVLNLRDCMRHLPELRLPSRRELVRLSAVVALMALAVCLTKWLGEAWLFHGVAAERTQAALLSFLGVGLGGGLFACLSLRLGVINLEDLRRIPRTGRLRAWLLRQKWVNSQGEGV